MVNVYLAGYFAKPVISNKSYLQTMHLTPRLGLVLLPSGSKLTYEIGVEFPGKSKVCFKSRSTNRSHARRLKTIQSGGLP